MPVVLMALSDIIDELNLQRNNREISLAITRLQEGLHWLQEADNGGQPTSNENRTV